MNKHLPYISLIISMLALGMIFLNASPSNDKSIKKETVYERVMRTRTLRCGYALWPVTEDMDPNTKQVKGIVPEFTQALGDKLGLKIEWVEEVIWGQEPEALASGRIDAICTTDGPWSYTSASVVDYAEPMAYFPVYLYGREGDNRFRNPQAANALDVTFSSIEGDISLAMPVDRFPKAHRLELPGSADPSLILTNVVTGKADLVLVDPLTISRFNLNNEKKLGRVYEKPLAVINMSFCVGKGQEDLLQMLNQGFQLLQSLGISDEILDRYDPKHELFYRPTKHWDHAAVASIS